MKQTITSKAKELDEAIAGLERLLMTLYINSEVNDMLTAKYCCNKLNKVGRTWRHIVDDKFMEWLGEHDGTLDVGPVRYYVGVNKKTVCVDIPNTMTHLLECAYGDVAVIAACLSATSFKHGTVHNVLGDDLYGDLFDTQIEQDLKTGKAKRVLKVADREFLKKR